MKLDAMSFFHRTACGVLGTNECYPMTQSNSVFPSIVYYSVGQDAVTMLEGAQQTATSIRYEVRSTDHRETVTLSQAVVAALRKGKRLRSLLSLTDQFDDKLSIYRRFRTVMVT